MKNWSQPTILIVEDEEAVLQVVSLILISEGYAVLSAGSEAEAMEAVRSNPGRIDILLADVKLKQGSGPALARRVKAFKPSLKIIYMSGYLREELVESRLIGEGDVFLAKPFQMDTFRKVVRNQSERSAALGARK